jgi:hypothetical protein
VGYLEHVPGGRPLVAGLLNNREGIDVRCRHGREQKPAEIDWRS